MTIRKILLVTALAATTSHVYSKGVSLWGKSVFPDDLSRLPSYEIRKIDGSYENEIDMKNDNVCETEECKRVAEEFLSGMNKSVDPCDNFYDFACGAWSQKDPIPPSKATWSRFMIFQDTVEHRIKSVLETEIDPSDILPVKQAKKWYRSCMDIENLERRGVKPIESILMQAGGWPIIMDDEEWDSEIYTWQIVEKHYAQLTGAYTFYNFDIFPRADEMDPGRLILNEPEMPLHDQLPLKYRNYSGNDYDTYVRLVEGAANLFVQHNRADVSTERIKKEAKEIVEFEKEIYMLEQFSEHDYMELEEFFDWYDTNMTEVNSDPKSTIDWKAVIKDLFKMVNIEVNASSTELFSTDFGYIRGIGKLLKKTPARTIVNYVHWNFVATMLPYTTEGARDELFELVNEGYGVKERAPRWSECVQDIKMTHATAYVFVNKYFTDSTKTAALNMITNIQSGMEVQIEKSNWMNEESKKWAKDKLNDMKMRIGFPDWYRNKTAVINYYKGLTIGAEYFDNTLSYKRYEAMKNLKKFLSTGEINDIWEHIDPITVNAVYGGRINMLSVPAADFQTPLFTPQFPTNINYATAGVIAGHEMGHGFDVNSIQYGKSSNSTPLPEDVLKNYYQNAKCFIDQFDVYYEGPKCEGTTDSSKVKMSVQTRGENMADTTGIQSVFEAYKKTLKESSSPETKLPGLEEFNDDQLFFLSFAAMWCEVERPEYKKKREESNDPHSPPKFRVMGAVSNMKDFAKTFNCPKGSPMNPTNKCSVWEKPGAAIKKEPGSKKTNHHRWAGQWRS